MSTCRGTGQSRRWLPKRSNTLPPSCKHEINCARILPLLLAFVTIPSPAQQVLQSVRSNQGSESAAFSSTEPGRTAPFEAQPLSPSTADLPDAPVPLEPNYSSAWTNSTRDSTVDPSKPSSTAASAEPPYVPLRMCPDDKTHAPECRVHWRQLLISSSLFLAFQNAGNAYTGYDYRNETTHGKWLDRYFNSVTGYKFSVWSDGNPFLDDYVAHPMMGAITDFLWIQNDPKGMTLSFSNTRPYWHSRLRALAFATVYSTEWKLGPAGESGVGHAGDHVAYDNGRFRVETGFVSLVTTPVGGSLWSVSEDLLDRYLITRLERRSHNPFALLGYSFLNPTRGTANILRFRPPWYRDTRIVKANSFWSDPGPGTDGDEHDRIDSMHREDEAIAETRAAGARSSEGHVTRPPVKSQSLPFGGTHEFGAWWGLSLQSGDIWGYRQDVKYMPIDLRYSYRFLLHDHWAMRYSPEITALAMLDEENWAPVDPLTQRRRTYGSGISPEGFQVDFRPHSRVQPFLSNNGGFIYFTDRVLSPQGSRFMYTIDFGGGVNIFRKRTQAVTIGYRYQHLSNANISLHNPGTDANTFYVGVSRFRTREDAASH